MKINLALLKRYKEIARRWNSAEYAGIRRDDMIPELIKLMDLANLQPKSRLLDAMCGTGLVGKAIETELEKMKTPGKVYFLDFSQDMLNQIDTTSVNKVRSDVRSIPFPNNFFERIILRGSLHDLDKESQREAIKEIFRVLKKDGLFILSEFCTTEESQCYYNLMVAYKDSLSGYHDVELERYFPTREDCFDLFAKAGFQTIKAVLEYTTTITYSKKGELGDEYEKWKFLILNFPKHIRTQMNIMENENGLLSYDFPLKSFISRK